MGNDIPNIRFSGTGVMHSVKIKDVFDLIPTDSKTPKQDVSGNNFLFERNEVKDNEIVDDVKPLKLTKFDSKKNLVRGGDVLITTSGDKENISLSSVINIDLPNLYCGSFLFHLRPKMSFDNYYLATVLRIEEVRNQLMRKGQPSSSMVNMSKNDLLNTKIIVTDIETQKNIGHKFKLLHDEIKERKEYGEQLKQFKQFALDNLMI